MGSSHLELKVIVWPKGESAFMGTVSDVEAFNKNIPKKQALVIGLIFGIRKKAGGI